MAEEPAALFLDRQESLSQWLAPLPHYSDLRIFVRRSNAQAI